MGNYHWLPFYKNGFLLYLLHYFIDANFGTNLPYDRLAVCKHPKLALTIL